MSKPSPTISDSSYLTLLLHSLQNPHFIVGLLLSPLSTPQTVTHILPLAHTDLTIFTTSLLQTALSLSHHYATRNNLLITGVYFANDTALDIRIPVPAASLADTVHRVTGHCTLYIVDAKLLNSDSHCLQIFQAGRPTWARGLVQMPNLVSKKALTVAETAIKDYHCFATVADFEMHVREVQLDWLNPYLDTRLTKLLADA